MVPPLTTMSAQPALAHSRAHRGVRRFADFGNPVSNLDVGDAAGDTLSERFHGTGLSMVHRRSLCVSCYPVVPEPVGID
ncbi:hypothetical protein Alo02nite_26510 [Actinoplanes lobatus]|uniref:Uncharacterized protein n=1 Tax=Actinoplanes lobatus TaxID=113568 RepID=A0ABQ4AFH3_9ACTN|nr:hypothetical protein Alo02nite_26510 [Actinoplanes lobatus]